MSKNIVYPYIPNTVPEIKKEMMDAVNTGSEREIFEVIPDHLLYNDFDFPEPILDEYSLKRHTEELLDKNANMGTHLCFLGAGYAPHFIPAVVDEVLKRGELVTAYTSDLGDQGRGQMQFEYQSLMAELLDMDVTTFPQYDGGSSLGHAIRMTKRLTGRKKVLVAASINPFALNVAQNYLSQIDGNYCEIEMIAYDSKTGLLDLDDLKSKLNDEVAGVVIENPTFLGTIEVNAKEISAMAKAAGAEFTGTSAGLWTAAAGVYLATMGPAGMKEVGESIISRCAYAAKKLSGIKGVEIALSGPAFKEIVVDFSGTGKTVEEINDKLLEKKIIGGYDLSKIYDDQKGRMLLCVTEIHLKKDIDKLVDAIAEIVA